MAFKCFSRSLWDVSFNPFFIGCECTHCTRSILFTVLISWREKAITGQVQDNANAHVHNLSRLWSFLFTKIPDEIMYRHTRDIDKKRPKCPLSLSLREKRTQDSLMKTRRDERLDFTANWLDSFPWIHLRHRERTLNPLSTHRFHLMCLSEERLFTPPLHLQR